MRKLLLFALCATALILNSCSQEDSIVSPKTSLEISFKDDLGNPVRDVVVKLYSSETDLKNGTNQVGAAAYSNAEGVAIFNDLSNIKYYWFAEKGCLNNIYGSVTTTSPLSEGQRNTVTTILKSTGTLTLKSTSSNPYRIFINGDPIIDLQGYGNKSYTLPVGTFTVRVLQLSGYLIYPTDKTYSATIVCGATTEVIFP